MEQHGLPGNTRQFILDIGTRSVVGIAGHKEGDLFVVEAAGAEPHPRRAMIDGQIEDIAQVALVAGAVKERIERALNTRFSQVSVAAAGRALKTCRACAKIELPQSVPIAPQTVYSLEIAAVQEARLSLDAAEEGTPYYCVGHSAVRYLLDGYPFQTIVGHRAGVAEVEIIATFLPAEVVESLRQCMDLLELEIDTLTLEPIAAMRAVIPQDLRLLNLALADVGAGTSDIAISANGTVAGYTMATMAGDEVTETIIRQFLVDFRTAEQLKLALGGGEGPYPYTDILGFEQTAERAQLLETMEPAVDALARVIGERILECNAAAPAAVFLVGGASKTPGLCQKIAEKLGLPQNRVALAGTRFSGKILSEDSGLDGPEYATPVGIALTAADNAETQGASVYVNERRVRLFTPGETSVMDALLMGGYTYSDLMGRNGRSLTFLLNGARTVVRGGVHTAAELTVNGRAASLSTRVCSGDRLCLTTAQSGADATAYVSDHTGGKRPIRVNLNGSALLAGTIARVNGQTVPSDIPILEGDTVEVYDIRTVRQLCDAAGIPTEGATVAVNGRAADADRLLQDQDDVLCAGPGGTPLLPKTLAEPPARETSPAPVPSARPAVPAAQSAAKATLTPPLSQAASALPSPAGPSSLPAEEKAPSAPAQESPPAPLAQDTLSLPETPEPAAGLPPDVPPLPEAPGDSPVFKNRRALRIELNGKTVVLPPKPTGEMHRLFDLLTLVDIDPANPKGLVKVSINGREGAYLEELENGDRVDIGWEPRRGTSP